MTKNAAARGIRIGIAGAAAMLATFAYAGMDATAIQRGLDGTWVGDGTTLVLDLQHLQVNMNPDKPFEWKSFQLVNVTGKMIVFDIGRMRYVALLPDPVTMMLTSPSFVGERALHRR